MANQSVPSFPNAEEGGPPFVTKRMPTITAPRRYLPGRQYRGPRGKIVDWVEQRFEEGLQYIHVRFGDGLPTNKGFEETGHKLRRPTIPCESVCTIFLVSAKIGPECQDP